MSEPMNTSQEEKNSPVEDFDASQMISIFSKDGYEFVVDKRVAMVSNTIKAMLTGIGEFKEQQEGKIYFDEMETNILEKVIQYFHYKCKYDEDPQNRPDFKIDPEIALELMMAAHYLDS
eukprot:gb/GECH01014616.1/.p1 GENE.gb/GECH01014616.1/~~gb/GECH01014616.1/.p1  ORF type:complete len:119 (+),score=43.90 gb/GECH01014616.1/:1-357(+)